MVSVLGRAYMIAIMHPPAHHPPLPPVVNMISVALCLNAGGSELMLLSFSLNILRLSSELHCCVVTL